MINKLTFILTLLLLVSCQKNTIDKPKKPDNLISKDKMVEIIYDMSLITVAKGVNKRLLEDEGLNPREYVFKKHGIDSIQFIQSNNYYAYNLKNYDEIYTEVKLKLEKEKTYFNEVIAKEKRVNDSLKEERKNKLDTTKRARMRESVSTSMNNPLKKVDSSRLSTRQ